MKVLSNISKITFPTTETGELVITAWLEENAELELNECYGIGLKFSEYSNHKGLNIAVGNTVEIEFDEKHNIIETKIINEKKLFTLIPEDCATCGKPLFFFREKLEKGHRKTITKRVVCRNLRYCTAHSISPIIRLLDLAIGKGLTNVIPDSYKKFIHSYPESPLQHLSDFKIFLESDPNTVGREDKWKNSECWEIEKAVWNYFNKSEMKIMDFWFICLGNNLIDFEPRTITKHPDLDYLPIIKNNVDKIEQLLKFLDNYGVKCY